MNTHREQIRHKVLHLHDILAPPTMKADVIGPEPRRLCKFHKVKGYHTKDYYKLKKETKRLIYEGHLKKYVKGDSYRGSGGSKSYRKKDVESIGSIKDKEVFTIEDNKVVHHSLNTIVRGLSRAGRLAPPVEGNARQVLSIKYISNK